MSKNLFDEYVKHLNCEEVVSKICYVCRKKIEVGEFRWWMPIDDGKTVIVAMVCDKCHNKPKLKIKESLIEKWEYTLKCYKEFKTVDMGEAKPELQERIKDLKKALKELNEIIRLAPNRDGEIMPLESNVKLGLLDGGGIGKHEVETMIKKILGEVK